MANNTRWVVWVRPKQIIFLPNLDGPDEFIEQMGHDWTSWDGWFLDYVIRADRWDAWIVPIFNRRVRPRRAYDPED